MSLSQSQAGGELSKNLTELLNDDTQIEHSFHQQVRPELRGSLALKNMKGPVAITNNLNTLNTQSNERTYTEATNRIGQGPTRPAHLVNFQDKLKSQNVKQEVNSTLEPTERIPQKVRIIITKINTKLILDHS